MKTVLSILLLISSSLLVSCGAKKTSAVFEVTTSALSMANNAYQGGLVIMGKSSEGSFTIPVDYNSTSGKTSITLELKKANWQFSAVAWAGSGSAPKQFQGTTYCGAISADLQNDSEVVNIKLASVNCTNRSDLFGPSAYFLSGTEYDSLRIATCGWLYQDNGITAVSAATPLSFCAPGASIDDLYKRYPKTIKIEIPHIVNGIKTAGISICLSATDGVFNNRNLSIPARGLPFRVSLYDSLSCLDRGYISTFVYSDGFEGSQSAQDSVYVSDASTMNLFLPSNKMKLGYTGFYQSLPRLTCSGAECMKVPTAMPGGENRFIVSDREFVIELFSNGMNLECDHISGVTPAGTFSTTPDLTSIKANCRKEDNGDLVSKISSTSISPGSSITIAFTKNGVSQGSRLYTLYTNVSYEIFRKGWELFGYPAAIPAINQDIVGSFDIFRRDSDDRARGILDKVTNMFSPDGPAGVLGSLNCAATTRDSTISFAEYGEIKNYRVKLEAAPTGAGAPLVGADIAGGGYASTAALTKRLIVQRLKGAVYETEVVIDFICGQKIGRLESHKEKDGKEERSIVKWNTITNGSGVVISKSKTVETDGSGVSNYRAEVARVEQTSIADAKAFSFGLEIKRNGAVYDYYGSKQKFVSDASNDRIFHIQSNASTLGLASINDANYDNGAFGTAIVSQTPGCVIRSVPVFVSTIDTPCSTVGGPASTAYAGISFNYESLLETNIDSNFTAALPVPAP